MYLAVAARAAFNVQVTYSLQVAADDANQPPPMIDNYNADRPKIASRLKIFLYRIFLSIKLYHLIYIRLFPPVNFFVTAGVV